MFIFNNLNLLFLFMTMVGTLFSISSNSWIGAWMGLEINMISFLPLIIHPKNILCNETALKYFLVQALASVSFISFCLLNSFQFSVMTEMNTLFSPHPLLMSIPLIMKLGGAPFQFWFISAIEGLPWPKALILLTWQKIAPLFILSYLLKNYWMIYFWSILSIITGAIGGLNQTSTKKILTYSSINHMGWLMSTFLLTKNLLFTYLGFYIFLNVMIVNFIQKKNLVSQLISSDFPMSLSFSLLSLGGLPPLLGFLPKWMIIQNLIFFNHFLLCFLMIMMALITLYFYTRMIFSNLILSSSKSKSQMYSQIIKNPMMNFFFIMMNLSGFFLFNLF